ncbi:ATP-binding cassette domain-containing protein [Paenactinomyces guangxiensis]|uniref:ATP-binding cassette domain-containing protein n=1 Tax=Paenactinomyces guangxiensis TaxID=1490290 RepID=A0A7W1WSU9_9BACL|nr:ATP-binding cassette domain-containing protein [Paenactinomyces guangxiensis]MBA4495420.1 ATP-binding cassette domain-containing protein [Paenactinomyces guangxiensis]MBH8592459.1 ATP-binding cassette domain-containing protein [Paenactinomyces guangxiensis]
MLSIEAHGLTKEFKVYQSRPGLTGAFRDLLNRKYRTIRAVDSIDLRIGKGEMVGYIGENGAGKSTTIKMLTGILQPTAGELKVNGYDPHRQREEFVKTIGVVFGQRSQLWWDIAVQESFRLLQKVYRIPAEEHQKHLDRMIEVLDISSLLDQPVRKLSLGQRMRCELAASLIHRPSLLFLDEPTIGLDVLVKENIRRFLKEINREFGTTILLTTHDLSDIEALCSRVVMLDQGKIIYDGGLAQLRNLWGGGKKIHLEMEKEVLIADLQGRTDGLSVSWEQKGPRQYTVHVQNGETTVSEVLSRLVQHVPIQEMQIEEATTEEIVRKIYSEGMTIA